MATYGINAVPATGGWNGLGPYTAAEPGDYVYHQNCEYTNAGTLMKRKGFSRLNASAIEAATTKVIALADFHRMSVSGGVLTDTRRLVAATQSTVPTHKTWYSDDNGATWTVLNAAWGTTDSNATITIADGFAVFADGVNAPRKWDQTTESALGASAPVARAFTYHLRRLFSVGEASGDGSTVKYCAASDITDWTGGDTGSLPAFDENDGDYVIGASRPLNGRIYFFKGPNLGSLHELSGRTPATFQTDRISTGSPCLDPRSVVTTNSDVFWTSWDGVHSLKALQSTGVSCISTRAERLVNIFNPGLLTSGFHNPRERMVGWIGPAVVDSQTSGILCYYYTLDRWALMLPKLGASPITLSSAAAITSSGWTRYYEGKPGLSSGTSSAGTVTVTIIGTATGFVHAQTRATDGTLSDVGTDNTARTFNVVASTPKFYSIPPISGSAEKQLLSVGLVGMAGTADATVTAAVRQEGDTSGTNYTLTFPNSGVAPNPRDGLYQEVPVEGITRWVQVTYTETSDNSLQINGYTIRVAPATDFSLARSGVS